MRLNKGPFTQAIFAVIFLLLVHAIKWIDLRMYRTIWQSYTFVTQPLNRMRQKEKNRHKNRPCKQALSLLGLIQVQRFYSTTDTETRLRRLIKMHIKEYRLQHLTTNDK